MTSLTRLLLPDPQIRRHLRTSSLSFRTLPICSAEPRASKLRTSPRSVWQPARSSHSSYSTMLALRGTTSTSARTLPWSRRPTILRPATSPAPTTLAALRPGLARILPSSAAMLQLPLSRLLRPRPPRLLRALAVFTSCVQSLTRMCVRGGALTDLLEYSLSQAVGSVVGAAVLAAASAFAF